MKLSGFTSPGYLSPSSSYPLHPSGLGDLTATACLTLSVTVTRKPLHHGRLEIPLKEKLVKFNIWSVSWFLVWCWRLGTSWNRPVISYEPWTVCWRRMEKIGWTQSVRNEGMLHVMKEERNILHKIKWRKVNWIGHILRLNYVLKHVIERKIEVRQKEREDEEEDVSRYWMTLRKR